MKNVLAIIGSPNGKKSNTRAMTLDFLELLKEYTPDVQTEVLMLGDSRLQFCQGCWACTKTGVCVLKDDLQEIQQKLLNADLFILGTPVYVHQVSAQTKVFFDRIYVWIHIVKLIGKPTITAITTAATGRRRTERYLDDMLSAMGAIVIGHLRGIADTPGHFPKRAKCRERHRKLAQKTAAILEGRTPLKPRLKNLWGYYGMKCKAKYAKDVLPFEHAYWQEKGWFGLSYKQAWQQELAHR